MSIISGQGWQARFKVEGDDGSTTSTEPIVVWQEGEDGLVDGLIAAEIGDRVAGILMVARDCEGFVGYEPIGSLPLEGRTSHLPFLPRDIRDTDSPNH